MPVTGSIAEPVSGLAKLVSDGGEFVAGSVDFSVDGAGVFAFECFPLSEGLLEAHLSGLEMVTNGLGDGLGLGLQLGGQLPLLFGDFREEDSFLRDASEVSGEAELMQDPDGPFGGVELPWFHPVAIVVLEGVMKVVITFAEGEEGHQTAVSGGATV